MTTGARGKKETNLQFEWGWGEAPTHLGKAGTTMQSNTSKKNKQGTQLHIRDRSDCVCSLLSHVQLRNPMERSPPGSSVRVILQARILERVTIPFFRGSS